MDKEQQIDIKLIRYLSGTANPAEKKEVLAWVKQSDRNKYEFERLKAFWKLETEDQKLIHHEELKAKIWNAYNRGHQNKFKRWGGNKAWYRVAAAISFLLVASIIFVNRASIFSASKPTPVTLLSKENPRGQKSQFQLPDGSKVWLNAESKISFPEIFSDTARLVTLEGEAFFDVKKDPLKPFIVKIGDLNVKVLGTSFDVKAYLGDEKFHVAVVTGKVKVSTPDGITTDLLPNQATFYDTQSGSMAKTVDFDQELLLGWKEKVLKFKDTDYEEVFRRLSNWYDVEFIFPEGMKLEGEYSARFKDQSLANVLLGMEHSTGLKYKIKDKVVYVKKGKN